MAKRKRAAAPPLSHVRRPARLAQPGRHATAAVGISAPAAAPPPLAEPCAFLRTWLWKREAKGDADRFDRPYEHTLEMAGAGQRLVLEQRRFDAEGFASTIWDSAIVLARYLEHRCSARSAHSAAAAAAGTAAAAGPPPYSGGPLAGASAVELGAGCGLVACVASALGAAVVATDLEANLALLRRNLERNATPGRPPAAAAALRWGGPAAARLLRAELGGAAPSLLLASDVMYIADAVPDLVATLVALCDRTTEVLLAHGRNRPAEDSFLRIAGTRFAVAVVPDEDLHPVYQCLDVTVLRLRLRPGGGEGSAGE